jgi:uncharacterized protein YneF (UPF0154 family)
VIFRRAGAFGAQANAAVNDFASRLDGHTVEVADRAAQVIAVAVRVLRIPTALVGAASIPFIATTIVLGLIADGGVAIVMIVAGIVMAIVNGLFWLRRSQVVKAVDDPPRLATELGIMLAMTGRVDETRGALAQITGGKGWRVLGRLRGVWEGAQLTGHWIDQIGDLPRARYFGPPRIGTTITITIAALWLVPVSVVVALFAVVGTVAGSI